MIRLVGNLWRVSFLHINKLPILSVNLELASWKNNDCLTEYLLKIFSHFTPYVDVIPLSIDDLNRVMLDMEVLPQTIYGEDGKLRAKADLEKFQKSFDWLKENFPYASVSYDYLEK